MPLLNHEPCALARPSLQPHAVPAMLSFMRYTYVLFDLDGTLIDPLDDLTNAANASRQAVGLEPLRRETVRRFVGDGLAAFMQRSVPAELIERATPVFKEHYAAHLTDHTRLYPGVKETLQRLHAAGCRMAVVSNKPTVFAQRILSDLGLQPYLSVIFGGDSLPQRKPAPEPYLKALEQLGGTQEEGRRQALVVGDGHQDIQSARAGGLAVCGVLYGMGQPDDIRALKPDYLIERIEELTAVVMG
jgi:phosphoglycolate phosphatase